ncbi:spermidine synthase [Paenibacillus aestuarii]|uniref:Spermidine synthase n=1 Tax=Paenibacillus aestuarii TaxID=516965 RepID=A0ABW0KF14_9BACL|nr:fused MFS/spermidine synthase [Paenibacillus aestuarii]
MNLLFKNTDQHREITVYETSELDGKKGTFRVLQFSDQAVQGAMDLKQPARIIFEYPRAMLHLMHFNDPSFEDVFVIGHGIGTIARNLPNKRVKVAELDENVVELSRRYFGYSLNNVIVGDGREILDGEKPHTYDYIVLDAFNRSGTPPHLTSREFFRLAKDKLNSKGAILMNLIGRGAKDKLVSAIHSTLSTEFAYIKTFALPSESDGDVKNIILMGGNRPFCFQSRNMAGFIEMELEQGHVFIDVES